MKVTKVILTTFRNYRRQEVEFCPSLNIVEGSNASGKTNLLESVYLCGVGKSHRAGRDKEMITMGESEAHVTLFVDKKYRSHRVDINIMPNGKKIAIDGVGVNKMADLMGVVNVVLFAPDELKIVKEDPAERRRFMNISLCQQSKSYYDALSRYNRILENRNALIKKAETIEDMERTLPDWNVQLAEEGAKIIMARQDFLVALEGIADPIHRAISGEDRLSLHYLRQEDHVYDVIYNSLLSSLSSNYPKELALRYTASGPHRDDFSILVDGLDIRTYGSQGQQRTAALALKLAEITYFERNTGEKPILLLDDVLSELDPARREALLVATQDVQTILTCTDYTEKESYIGKRIFVNKGSIV